MKKKCPIIFPQFVFTFGQINKIQNRLPIDSKLLEIPHPKSYSSKAMLNNTVTAFKAGSATTRMSSMEDAQAKVLSQGFSNYAQQTSLHGWQYIDIEPGWFRKTFWAIVSC